MLSIIGLIVIILPFLSLFFVKRDIKTVSRFIIFWFTFHILVGLILLVFGHFRFFNVIILHLITYFTITLYLKNRGYFKFNPVKRINIPVVISGIIIIFTLASIHLNYSGDTIDVEENYIQVENFQILYPTYSDEWVGIAYIRDAVLYNTIPLHNPYIKGESFMSFAFIYYILLAELNLLSGLDLVLFYVVIKIIVSTIILFSIYFLLRKMDITAKSASITVLLMLFITNSAVAPGLWYLVPFSLSILLFFLAFNNLISLNKLEAILLSIISFVLYPPSLVIFFILFVFEFFFYKKNNINIKTIFIWFVYIALISLGIFLSIYVYSDYRFSDIVDRAYGFIIRPNLLPINWFYNIRLQDIIPFNLFYPCLILLSLLWYGRKYFIASVISIFIIISFIYKAVPEYTFIIDFVRISYITSILAMLSIPFFLDYVGNFFTNKNINLKYIQWIVLFIFIILSINYTELNEWEETGFLNNSEFVEERVQSKPAIQARYSSSEVEVFKTLGESNVLSSPWKGLILGSVTDMQPLDVKESVVGVKKASLAEFTLLNCIEKVDFAERNNIDYVYSRRFSCPSFREIIQIDDSLFLFEFENRLTR